MSITTLGVTAWLWKQNKPNNIVGKRENRKLLLVRAFGGFLGVFGLYCTVTATHLGPPKRSRQIRIPLTMCQTHFGT